MIKFFPIENAHASFVTNMANLAWRAGALTADFVFHDDDNWLRVHFPNVEIVRLLDEMPISTEEDWESGEGHVAGHFAYRVEGAHFWLSQSEAFRATYHHCHHYQFLTSETCLDVISDGVPVFSLTSARWDELD